VLEAVRDDIEAALEAVDPGDDPDGFRAVVEALTAYFEARSRCAEGVALMARLLARLRAREAVAAGSARALRRRLVAAEARLCRCGGRRRRRGGGGGGGGRRGGTGAGHDGERGAAAAPGSASAHNVSHDPGTRDATPMIVPRARS
jgi:uncharacterized membrane protein YgcG